jgi:hypothetical protein
MTATRWALTLYTVRVCLAPGLGVLEMSDDSTAPRG